MIGLDTNILVRYITQDDAAQAAKASALIESLSPEKPGFIPLIVIVELSWVVEGCYHAARAEIIAMLEGLLRSESLLVEQAEQVWQALRLFQTSAKVDFADCLIERCAHAAGCAYTATFDRVAAKGASMRLMG